LSQDQSVFGRISNVSEQLVGIRLLPEASDISPSLAPLTSDRARVDNQLELLLVDWTFGTEELSGYSPAVRLAESPPYLMLHSQDAVELGWGDGQQVRLPLTGTELEVEVKLSPNMARGIMVLPRQRGLAWQKLQERPMLISKQALQQGRG
jgi:hypothetical protein